MKNINSYSFFVGCILSCLLSTSCTKEPDPGGGSGCSTCGTISAADLSSLQITDSNWTRAAHGVFYSDLSPQLQQAGFSTNQVYAIYVIDENGQLQIFPYYSAKWKGGSISASNNTFGENDACVITFSYSKEDEHYGQLPNQGFAPPFQAIELKVMLLK
jgi:hypothetical protein